MTLSRRGREVARWKLSTLRGLPLSKISDGDIAVAVASGKLSEAACSVGYGGSDIGSTASTTDRPSLNCD